MTNEAKHTPGPWDWMAVSANASGGFHLYLIDAARRKIAALWGGAEEKQANAALIVRAVNSHADLLAALRAAVKTIASIGGDLEVAAPESINANTYRDDIARLNAAIVKATGSEG